MAKSKSQPKPTKQDGKTLLNNYIQNIKDGARNPSVYQPTKAQQHEAEAKKLGGSTTNPGGGQVIGMAAVSLSSGPGKVSAGGNAKGTKGPVEYRPIYGAAPKAQATSTTTSTATSTAAPVYTPASTSTPAMEQALQRATAVSYSPEEQPKLFSEGTPDPYDSTGRVAQGANEQTARNAKFSLAQQNIGVVTAQNYDNQLAAFGSNIPNAPKTSDTFGETFKVVERYKKLFA